MGKETTRNKILEHAGRIVRQKGFNNTGIQEILESAGVPKGSFYFYFKSKDDLGLALIDHYAEGVTSLMGSLHGDAQEAPLERLRKFFSLHAQQSALPAIQDKVRQFVRVQPGRQFLPRPSLFQACSDGGLHHIEDRAEPRPKRGIEIAHLLGEVADRTSAPPFLLGEEEAHPGEELSEPFQRGLLRISMQ